MPICCSSDVASFSSRYQVHVPKLGVPPIGFSFLLSMLVGFREPWLGSDNSTGVALDVGAVAAAYRVRLNPLPQPREVLFDHNSLDPVTSHVRVALQSRVWSDYRDKREDRTNGNHCLP